jgi:hypothetical protein
VTQRGGDADVDCDEDVDLSDLGTLATFYGSGEAQAYADFQALAVPEPAAAWLVLAGVAVRCRRAPRGRNYLPPRRSQR